MRLKKFASLYLSGFLLLAFHLALCASGTDSKPLIHPLFTDHAVIQRNAKIPVWGWAKPGTTVTVRFSGQEKNAIASPDGKWMVYLDPIAASSKGQTMTVTDKSDQRKIKIADVLVGDVWICSGQSNMEMGVGACNIPEEIASANFPRIRLLTVPKKVAYTPEPLLKCAWQPCSPKTLMEGSFGGFSAAGYFFGRELYQELDVPIGLISSSWGGTVIASCLEPMYLLPMPGPTNS